MLVSTSSPFLLSYSKPHGAYIPTLSWAPSVNGTGVQPASITELLGDQGGSKPVTFYPDQFSVKFTATDDALVQVSFTLLNKHDAAGPDQQG